MHICYLLSVLCLWKRDSASTETLNSATSASPTLRQTKRPVSDPATWLIVALDDPCLKSSREYKFLKASPIYLS